MRVIRARQNPFVDMGRFSLDKDGARAFVAALIAADGKLSKSHRISFFFNSPFRCVCEGAGASPLANDGRRPVAAPHAACPFEAAFSL
jgi:hypothetical protein